VEVPEALRPFMMGIDFIPFKWVHCCHDERQGCCCWRVSLPPPGLVEAGWPGRSTPGLIGRHAGRRRSTVKALLCTRLHALPFHASAEQERI
jgi:hypothetical protein